MTSVWILLTHPLQAPQVGHALELMLHDESTVGQTFELYGPTNYSMAELSELVEREIIKNRTPLNIPKFIAKPAAYYLNKALWWPTVSADEIEREFHDQVIDPTAKTFKDLGIEKTPEVTDLIFEYLVSASSTSELNGIAWKTNNPTERLP
jgi:NADH dehydrogenase (ubiquinone) 1 alpha subcomplex subunit 9